MSSILLKIQTGPDCLIFPICPQSLTEKFSQQVKKEQTVEKLMNNAKCHASELVSASSKITMLSDPESSSG
jgi:hypothetical protein